MSEAPRIRISRAKSGPWQGRAVWVDGGGGAFSERFRHFALRVRHELERRAARTVVLTSPLLNEGKTTAACNLALALATMAGGKRVALVDLDLRKPAIASVMGAAPHRGVEDLLGGTATLSEVRIRTDLPSLDLFVVGKPARHAHELLAQPRLPEALDELAKTYDTVILDSPPLLLAPDVSLISPHADAIVLVVQAGSTRRAALDDALDLLRTDEILGIFMNGVRAPRHSRYYDRYPGDEGPT